MLSRTGLADKKEFILLFTIFLAGFATASIANTKMDPTPSNLAPVFHSGASDERLSPQDWIPEKDIHVYDSQVIIDIDNPVWATFTDTNSMDPVFDYGANAIEIIPSAPSQIKPGDIISYESSSFDGAIVHRVIETGVDENGWYAVMKGDNNPSSDPGKVRFSQVKRLVVAIIY